MFVVVGTMLETQEMLTDLDAVATDRQQGKFILTDGLEFKICDTNLGPGQTSNFT